MKKVIVTLMLAITALIAAPAVAQTQTSASQTQTQSCQKGGKECKGKKKCHRKGPKGKKGKKGCRKGSTGPAFRGVEMTPAQQAQIDTICSQAYTTYKATCTQAREAMAKDVDQRVQEVLTPEQFSVYKANKAQMQERKKAKCGEKGAAKCDGKGNKPSR